MTIGTRSRRGARDAGLTWIIGGALLIVATVYSTGVGVFIEFAPFGFLTGPVVFAVTAVMFAVGIGKAGSVTARRPLGTAALVALGVWTVLTVDFVSRLSLTVDPTHTGLNPRSYAVVTVNNVLLVIVAVIAAIEIGRARAVPRPWNWAPAWALGLLFVPWVVRLILGALFWPQIDFIDMRYQAPVDALFYCAVGVLLGALSIALGVRLRTREKKLRLSEVSR